VTGTDVIDQKYLDEILVSLSTLTHVAWKLNVIDSHHKNFMDPVHKCGHLNTIFHSYLSAIFLGEMLIIRTFEDCCQKRGKNSI
jgi:hypothetical protein